MSDPIVLRVQNLSKTFGSSSRVAGARNQPALDDVSLDLFAGECLALVGESGCGKTTLGKCILRLTEVDEGRVLFNGLDLVNLSGKQLRRNRYGLQMIFQNPLQALNPRQKVGKCVAEVLQVHHGHGHGGEALTGHINRLFSQVGLSEELFDRFPHELSGGQQQRVTIARALAAEPKVLVADEPTSSLDARFKRQIIDLLRDLQRQLGLTLLLISHDLAMVQAIANRVAVMLNGRIIEVAETRTLMASPQHPYSRKLLAAARRDFETEYA